MHKYFSVPSPLRKLLRKTIKKFFSHKTCSIDSRFLFHYFPSSTFHDFFLHGRQKKMQKKFLMNFWPEKRWENFFYKCTQQEQCEGTSDGFHVQIDKFSSFCINYDFLTQKKSSKVFLLTQSVRKSKLELVVWVKSINEWGDKEMRQSLGGRGSRPYKLYSIKAFPFLKGKLLQSFWCFFYSFPILLYVFWPIHKK